MIALLLLAAVPAPTPASPVPAISASNPATAALGREIAEILNSQGSIQRQLTKMFQDNFPPMLATDATYQRLEKALPGFTAEALAALQPEFERFMLARMPVLWNRLGNQYAATLSEAELRQTVAFFRSPTGAWMVSSLERSADPMAVAAKSLENPDYKLTTNDINDALGGAKKVLEDEMTPERGRASKAFVLSPAGQKLRGIQSTLIKISVDWANEPTPELDKRIEEISEEIVERLMARRTNDATKGPTT